jgi:hypothetical protein
LSLKILTAFIFLSATLILSPLAAAEEFNIYFKTSPPSQYLRPFYDPGTLSLLVTVADGKPLGQGWAEIRLDAPEPGRFFSTDFPLVEGSRLIEVRLPLRRGRTEWKYLFPIRGEYRLTVDVLTTEGKKASKVFPLQIKEHQSKWSFFGLFTLGLFALGLAAGRIFTQASPLGKTKVAGCLSLSTICLLSPAGLVAQETGTAKYFGWLEADPATVGKPVRVRWRLEGEGSRERPMALLTLTIAHLEKGKTVFSVERLPVVGEFSMNFQFADSAEYRVTAIGELQGQSIVRTEQYVSVSGVEPSATTMIPALGFFLAVIAAGAAERLQRPVAAPLSETDKPCSVKSASSSEKLSSRKRL